jgi:hypothetical protein
MRTIINNAQAWHYARKAAAVSPHHPQQVAYLRYLVRQGHIRQATAIAALRRNWALTRIGAQSSL